MARVYAREEETDRRILIRLECDHPGCAAVLKPGPDVADSGWKKTGSDKGTGTEKYESDFCSDHG